MKYLYQLQTYNNNCYNNPQNKFNFLEAVAEKHSKIMAINSL